jgi:hypothetical protein
MRRALFALAIAACTRADTLEPLRMADVRARFGSADWALLESPIQPPTSTDGRQRIRVWLRASGEAIDARRDGERWVLSYAPGTCAERIESRDGVPVDVRGTEFDASGEVFHAMRGDGHGGATGYEWRRGDARACDDAKRALEHEIVRHEPGTDVRFYCRTGDCKGCHVHDKPAHDGSSRPPLATDDGGLYRVMTVLEDDAPLALSRDRDVNAESAFVTITTDREGTRVGHFDMPRALREGDAHAPRSVLPARSCAIT